MKYLVARRDDNDYISGVRATNNIKDALAAVDRLVASHLPGNDAVAYSVYALVEEHEVRERRDA